VRSEEEFDEFLETTLLPELRVEKGKAEELRRMRQAVRIPLKSKAIVWAIGLVVAAVAGSFDLFLIFFGVPFLIDVYRMSRVKGPEIMNVREGLIRRVIEFWGPEFEYRSWVGELNFMTSIIEELDLNTRVWSKRGA
jgi:hypothetical protein